MKIQDYKEGIYINKNGRDIVEIIFKFTNNNKPLFMSDDLHDYFLENKLNLMERHKYFMENYVFCCEL